MRLSRDVYIAMELGDENWSPGPFTEDSSGGLVPGDKGRKER